jgi:hypothetical protein
MSDAKLCTWATASHDLRLSQDLVLRLCKGYARESVLEKEKARQPGTVCVFVGGNRERDNGTILWHAGEAMVYETHNTVLKLIRVCDECHEIVW